MPLITGADVVTFLGRGVASDFDLVALATDQWIKLRSDRQFERAQRIEWPINDSRGYVNTLSLAEYPIASIDEVRIDINGVFGDDTIVTDLSRFLIVDPRGEGNEIEYRNGWFYPGPRRAQFKYTAGWWPYGDTEVDHVGPRVPDYVWRMLLNAAAIVDDAGVLEVFPNDQRGGFAVSRWGGVLGSTESAIFSRDLLNLADSLKRW